MKVLIIGASGFIGNYLRRRLRQNTGFEVTSTYNTRPPNEIDNSWYSLEITDHNRLHQIFDEVNPNVVVLLAAIADVKAAEIEKTRTTEVNVGGCRQVARLCTLHNARLIFLSSEYVFQGDRGNYREDDEPAPNTHYGLTKWQAELAIADEASQWSIVRTSLVFGWPITGRRNVATVVVDRLKARETYEGDTNTYRTPIYVEHLTEGITQLVKNYHPGTFHIAGTDLMNMYQFGISVAEAFNLNGGLVTQVSTLSDIALHNPAVKSEKPFKPDLLGLSCYHTSEELELPVFSVITGLRAMLGESGTLTHKDHPV